MTQDVRDWLPACALADSSIRARLEAVVRAWAERWFVGTEVRIADLGAFSAEAMAATETDWRTPGEQIAVSASRTMTQHLIQRALDVSLDGLVLTETDRCVTQAFAAKVLDDLALALETDLGPTSGSGGARDPAAMIGAGPSRAGAVVVQMTEGRSAVAAVAIPTTMLVSHRKAQLAARPPPARMRSTLMQTLASEPVLVEAMLGSASLSLADLETLAPGDVLVLDGAISAGGFLQLASNGQPIARGGFGEADGHMALTLISSN